MESMIIVDAKMIDDLKYIVTSLTIIGATAEAEYINKMISSIIPYTKEWWYVSRKWKY